MRECHIFNSFVFLCMRNTTSFQIFLYVYRPNYYYNVHHLFYILFICLLLQIVFIYFVELGHNGSPQPRTRAVQLHTFEITHMYEVPTYDTSLSRTLTYYFSWYTVQISFKTDYLLYLNFNLVYQILIRQVLKFRYDDKINRIF